MTMIPEFSISTYDNDYGSKIQICLSEYNGTDCHIEIIGEKMEQEADIFFSKEELKEFIDYLEFFYSKMGIDEDE